MMVGLGNPGSDYVRTRHNTGFWFVEALAAKCGGTFRFENKFNAEICRVRVDGEELWLVKPQTYMNLSGDAVSAMARYYKIGHDEILVIHDELDLVPGTMKLKQGGGNAGHNGLKDISAKLATPNFWRLRLGIGHPRTFGWTQAVADFVLSAPSPEHREGIDTCIGAALRTVPALMAGDMTRANRTLAKYGTIKKPKDEKPKAEEKAPAASNNA